MIIDEITYLQNIILYTVCVCMEIDEKMILDRETYFQKDVSHHDPNTYQLSIVQIEEVFCTYWHPLKKVRVLAQQVKDGFEEISPFIQKITENVCPDCRNICCINAHSYYNYEDLVYIHALGLKPPIYEFKRKDSDPCQFLSEHGCRMERIIRPSGCNWYFCDTLFDSMEKMPGYGTFDIALGEVASLWLSLIDEFTLFQIKIRQRPTFP